MRDALEHLLADVVVQLRQGFRQQVGRHPENDDRTVLGGQEAHQVGDVGGVQVFQQRAELQPVAGVGGVDDLLDEIRREDIVLVEGDVLGFSPGGDGQGGVCDLAHAWPPCFQISCSPMFRPVKSDGAVERHHRSCPLSLIAPHWSSRRRPYVSQRVA